MWRPGSAIRSTRERGFTLLELMVVVAVVAILAAIALPAFFKDARKGKASSEISPMFAELASREEQYKVDQNVYLSAAACPAAAATAGQDATGCIASGTTWSTLRVLLPTTNLFCSYAVTAGIAGSTPSPPTGFTMTTPTTGWFFIVATCDMDGVSTTNSTYFTSSVDSTIQKQNEGK